MNMEKWKYVVMGGTEDLFAENGTILHLSEYKYVEV